MTTIGVTSDIVSPDVGASAGAGVAGSPSAASSTPALEFTVTVHPVDVLAVVDKLAEQITARMVCHARSES